MESHFSLCPTCEALLLGDETSCPNCGTTFEVTNAGALPAEPPRSDVASAIEPLPPYEYLVLTARYEPELQNILNNTASDGWEPISVYFGYSMEREASVHFVVLRRRNPLPFRKDETTID